MVYDISQKVFGCAVYEGDPTPKKIEIARMEDGSNYNLTSFSMCAHNGTHVDAPYHFFKNGKTVDEIDLQKLVGSAFVYDINGEIGEKEALQILETGKTYQGDTFRRILLKGDSVVTLPAAKVFAEAGIFLIGTESQSVGPVKAPMAVHLVLLEKEVVLLEGIRLEKVPAGTYTLMSAPINLNGIDGAPCRAILVD